MKKPLKIGTRGSPLALAQTRLFIAALAAKDPSYKDPAATEIVTIATTGDKSQSANTALAAEGGGKALFAKEIEDALLEGSIDCAVHSMKDMPPEQPKGLIIPAVLPRGDVRDAFFSRKADSIEGLPQGAIFGTSSPRRAAIVLALRPDLKVQVFRGNVATRLKKLDDGIADATLLAAAGLKRLGLDHLLTNIIEPDVMLPAAGQGAICIEVRENDSAMCDLAALVNCRPSFLRVTAERAFIKAMDGSCRTPLAALMERPDPEGRARFDVLAADAEGKNPLRLSYLMSILHEGDAERLGAHAGREMKDKFKA